MEASVGTAAMPMKAGAMAATLRPLHLVQHTRYRSFRLTSPKLRSHSPSSATMLRVCNIAVIVPEISYAARVTRE